MANYNCIDVSTINGVIDWKTVASSGCKYAIIKATQGHGVGAATKNLFCFTDSKFVTNINGAFDAGIKCGVYHYMTARTIVEADKEADYFLSVIAPYKSKIKMWVALDVEDPTYLGSLSAATLTAVTKHFLDRIDKAGYHGILYTNPNYLIYRFIKGAFDNYPVWLAHYNVSKPYAAKGLKIWQYGGGRVPGVNSTCDLDIFYEEPYTPPVKEKYTVGGKYTLKNGDMYVNGVKVPSSIIGHTYTIAQVKDDRILLKEILSWVRI